MFNLLFIIINTNISYLSNTHLVQSSSVWGNQKQVAQLRQNYYDKIRSYNYLESNYENELRYYQEFSGRSDSFHDLYMALKNTQVSQYVQNGKRAEQNGDISSPIVYTSAAMSFASGNTVKANIGDMNVSENLNVQNATASSYLEDNGTKIGVEANARSASDALTAYNNGTEIYKITAQGSFVLGTSGVFNYGGTTGIAQASLSHSLFRNASLVVDKSWAENFPTEVSGKVGYQVKF